MTKGLPDDHFTEEDDEFFANHTAPITIQTQRMDRNNHLDLRSLIIIPRIPNKRRQRHQRRNPHLGNRIMQQLNQPRRCILPNPLPLGLWIILPQLRNQQRSPMSHQRFRRILRILQHLQTNLHHPRRRTGNLALLEIPTKHGEDKSAHTPVFGDTVVVDVQVQIGFLGGGEESDKVGVAIIFDEVYLAGFIDGEDPGPDED